MQDRWTAGVAPVNGAGNIYANLLEAFVAAFPVVRVEHVAAAREACRLLARSIVCADRVVDADVAGLAQAENVLAAQVCQLEGIRLLQLIVPPTHPFWAELAARLREFADASFADAAAHDQAVIDLPNADRIALGKNALARIVAPLACVLGGEPGLQASFDSAIVHLIVAVQALDDALDWRSDFGAHRLSLVTARIWSSLGKDVDAARAELFVHDVALRDVLTRGHAALLEARAIPELRSSELWMSITGKILTGYDSVLDILA
jgi:hypothetical protein